MKIARFAAACAVVLSTFTSAQSAGPDVIVGELYDRLSHGVDGATSTYGYSIGTYSCNIGTANLLWISNTNQHPVIGGAMYRVKNGRFEQIGLSWLKHGFLALTDNLCNTCQNPGSGALLGVGCADPYSASLNGNAGNLGPRYQVNPYNGFFNYPYAFGPTGATVTRGRIQVASADNDPAQNIGAQYLVEGQYVTPDDAAFGNQMNNASYRRITIAADAARTITFSGPTVRQKPVIWGWQEVDPTVSVHNVDVPGEGRFIVGYKATNLGGGNYRHSYAIQNLNSDRCGNSFNVTLPMGVTATSPFFRSIAYHSGEPQTNAPWTFATTPGSSAGFTGPTYPVGGVNQQVFNALRWGTAYTCEFEANSTWLPEVSIGLFKPGSPAALAATMCKTTGLPQVVIGNSYTNTSVAYDFIDATGGTSVAGGDDVGTIVALPFTFNIFGQAVTSVVVSTNGYIADAAQPGTVFQNVSIPNTGLPNNMIAAFWDDLEVGPPGGSVTGWCRYLTTGTAPNRRFVVHWNEAQRFNSNTNISFQMILDETSNNVTITHILTNGGSSATRGIENSTGTAGTQISHNTVNSALAGTSRRLTYSPGVVPQSALLTMGGDGSFANPFSWNVVSEPNKPLTLFVDIAPGPVLVPGFGELGLGLTPGLFAIADASGVFFGIFDPTAYTNACNEWNMLLPVQSGPVDPNLIDIWLQALVYSTSAPNGLAHISTVATY